MPEQLSTSPSARAPQPISLVTAISHLSLQFPPDGFRNAALATHNSDKASSHIDYFKWKPSAKGGPSLVKPFSPVGFSVRAADEVDQLLLGKPQAAWRWFCPTNAWYWANDPLAHQTTATMSPIERAQLHQEKSNASTQLHHNIGTSHSMYAAHTTSCGRRAARHSGKFA
jgi:hypothetical protein